MRLCQKNPQNLHNGNRTHRLNRQRGKPNDIQSLWIHLSFYRHAHRGPIRTHVFWTKFFDGGLETGFHGFHPVPNETSDAEARGPDFASFEGFFHLMFPDFDGGLVCSEFEGTLLCHVMAVYGEGTGFARVDTLSELVYLFGFVLAVETFEGLSHEL
jgi:hypothetical protein